jgi:hypothetical protein
MKYFEININVSISFEKTRAFTNEIRFSVQDRNFIKYAYPKKELVSLSVTQCLKQSMKCYYYLETKF